MVAEDTARPAARGRDVTVHIAILDLQHAGAGRMADDTARIAIGTFDCLHVVVALGNGDGLSFRRFGITDDASHIGPCIDMGRRMAFLQRGAALDVSDQAADGLVFRGTAINRAVLDRYVGKLRGIFLNLGCNATDIGRRTVLLRADRGIDDMDIGHHRIDGAVTAADIAGNHACLVAARDDGRMIDGQIGEIAVQDTEDGRIGRNRGCVRRDVAEGMVAAVKVDVFVVSAVIVQRNPGDSVHVDVGNHLETGGLAGLHQRMDSVHLIFVGNEIRGGLGTGVGTTGILVDVGAVELHVVELALHGSGRGGELLIAGIDRVVGVRGAEPQEHFGARGNGPAGGDVGIDLQDVVGIGVLLRGQGDRQLGAGGEIVVARLDLESVDGAGGSLGEFRDDADDAGGLREADFRKARDAGRGGDVPEVVRGAVLGLGLLVPGGEGPVRDHFHVIAGRVERLAFEGSVRGPLTADEVEHGGYGRIGRIGDEQLVAGFPGMGHAGRLALAVERCFETHSGNRFGERGGNGDGLGGRSLLDGSFLGTGGRKGDERQGRGQDVDSLHTAVPLKLFVKHLERIHLREEIRFHFTEETPFLDNDVHGRLGSLVRPLGLIGKHNRIG